MYFTQYEAIMQRKKTCTQRVEKPGDHAQFDPDGQIVAVYNAKGRLKWAVGRDYAVAPGRGQMAIMVLWHWLKPEIHLHRLPKTRKMVEELDKINYQPLKIRILKIERPRVQQMDERVAIAEGVESVAAYETLWRSLNGNIGRRWEDNPWVWRLWFEMAGKGDKA